MIDVADVAKPVVDEAMRPIFNRRRDAAAAVMAADDDVFNFKNLNGVLKDGEAVEVGMDDEVGDVAMDEEFAGE